MRDSRSKLMWREFSIVAAGIALGACGGDTGADADADSGVDAADATDTADAVPEDTAEGSGAGDTTTELDVGADVPIDGPIANVRIINLTPTAPPLEAWIDGQVPGDGDPFDSFAYLETAPPTGHEYVYVPYSATPHEAIMLEDGGTEADAFYTDTWNFSPEAFYTVYVYGIWESTDLKYSATIGVVVDDPSPPAENATRMRFVQLATCLNDVTIRSGDTDLTGILGFSTYTPDYITAEVGTYELQVYEGGELVFEPRITVGQETMNVFLVGDSRDDLAMVTVNQGNALTVYSR